VQRYQGQPFVVLGVNSDPSPEALRQVQEAKQLPWRSWWDGPGGPVARRWGATALPTVVLLDARGAVRWRSQGRPDAAELEREIEQLLHEAPQ
jgi:hypothetical protein